MSQGVIKGDPLVDVCVPVPHSVPVNLGRGTGAIIHSLGSIMGEGIT